MTGIEGKVAKIIDEFTIVINRGHEHGVEEDMRFIIYNPGDEITDPDSGEALGIYEYVKAKVRVINVKEKISTAISDETIEIPRNLWLLNIALRQNQTQTRELNLDKETKTELVGNRSDGIKKGDLVRQILY